MESSGFLGNRRSLSTSPCQLRMRHVASKAESLTIVDAGRCQSLEVCSPVGVRNYGTENASESRLFKRHRET